MNTACMFAAQVPRRKRSWVLQREPSMEHTEDSGDQVVVSTRSVAGNGDGAPAEPSTSSDRPRRVRPREMTVAAIAADQSVPGSSCGGRVDLADGDSEYVEKLNESERERRRKEEFEKERLRKGKIVAEEQSPPTVSGGGTPNVLPAAEKLMSDAIRGGRRPHVMTTGTKKTKRGHGKFWAGLGNDGASTSSAGSDMVVSLDNISVVHDRLRNFLKGLGVSPVRVYGKMMRRTDRLTSQNRLQMSRKKDGELFSFDEILTQEEKWAIASKPKKKSDEPRKTKKNDKHKEDDDNDVDTPNHEPNNDGDGLLLQAYDRTGEEYILTFKHISSNNSYRLMGQWGRLLKNCSLVLEDETNNVKKANKKGKKAKKKVKKVAIANEAMIDLWVFRSPKLSRGKDDNDDGRLGLVIVHYFKGEASHADAAFKANEDLLTRAQKKVNKDQEAVSSHEENEAVMEALPQEEPNGVAVVELEIAATTADEAGVQVGAPEPHEEQEVAVEELNRDAIHQPEIAAAMAGVQGVIDPEVLSAAEILVELKLKCGQQYK